jgi:hypothetical protein
MAYSVTGTGPVAFLDENSSQHEIPLSALSLESNKISASSWPGYTAQTSAIIDGVLAWMLAQGFLAAGASITAPLTITAAQAGVGGNDITVTFTPDAATDTMTVTVATAQTFAGLDVTMLASALGTDAASSAGVIYIGSPEPATGVPAALLATTVGAGGLVVNDATDTALFTLDEADASATPAKVTVAISLDGPPNKFTITATSSKTATGLKMADLVGSGNPFSLLVTFSGPVDTLLPPAGTVTLTGGTAASTPPAVPATPATTTVLTS